MSSNEAQLLIQSKLREAFTVSRIRNPAYSLRAFARTLQISPSAIHEILNGKRQVSIKLARKLLERIHLSPIEIEFALERFQAAKSGSKNSTPSERHSAVEYERLPQDQFQLISDWYHFAILSLAETEDFKSDPEWIAKRLNLGIRETQDALDRLERMNMLIRNPSTQKLECTGINYSTPDEIKNLALRKSHHQNLDLARNSLEQHDINQRDFTALTMAIDPDKIPEAKKRIRAFLGELMEFMESGKKTEVHRICFQLYPLTQTGEET